MGQRRRRRRRVKTDMNRNEKAGAKRPLVRILCLFPKFSYRSSPARPDAVWREGRIARLRDVRGTLPTVATVRSRITVIAVADAATENHAEDGPEHPSVTGARTRSITAVTVSPFTTVRICRYWGRTRNGRRYRIRSRLGSRGGILLHHFSLRLLGVRDDGRLGRGLHRRMLRSNRLRTSALFQCKRRRWSARLGDFGERKARRPLLRCQVEPRRRRELQISFEIVAHRAIRRRRSFPACRDDNGRQADREHRRSQDRTHSVPPKR